MNRACDIPRHVRYFSASAASNIRLLNTSTLELTEFIGSNTPSYAILSHTWGSQEVSLNEMRHNRAIARSKAAFTKIERCCEKALGDGYPFVWIDSCCIDKQSSAELSEAINSMYRWYQAAGVCYAYLSDVPTSESSSLFSSRWFTRGWTLQELIAPQIVQFFAEDWSGLGTRNSLAPQLQATTGIDWDILVDDRETSANALSRACTAQKMLWASGRRTTREEDMAYCLMGLFGVHMPVIYGEGLTNAFRRLQFEIIKHSPDQSIFAWSAPLKSSGLLADSPADFAQSSSVIQGTEAPHWWATLKPFSMTNFGMSINLPLSTPGGSKEKGVVLARIGARRVEGEPLSTYPISIYLKPAVRITYGAETKWFYRRIRCNELAVGPEEKSMTMYVDMARHANSCQDIYVPDDKLYHAFVQSKQKYFASQLLSFAE